MEAFSLQKVVKILEEVVVCWWEVRWIWQMRQISVDQFIQLLKHWLCDMWLGIVVIEKNWALSVDQCWLQALQFWMHLIDLLSTLLRCNGFAGIRKAIVDPMGSRPPNSDHKTTLQNYDFFWLAVSSWGTHFPICFKCQKTVERLMLGSWKLLL